MATWLFSWNKKLQSVLECNSSFRRWDNVFTNHKKTEPKKPIKNARNKLSSKPGALLSNRPLSSGDEHRSRRTFNIITLLNNDQWIEESGKAPGIYELWLKLNTNDKFWDHHMLNFKPKSLFHCWYVSIAQNL